MEQALHFLEECEVLADAIDAEGQGRWNAVTQFKQWTINDVLVHLHFWNEMADLSFTDPDQFKSRLGHILPALQKDGMRGTENSSIPQRDSELFALWQETYRSIAQRWRSIDPKLRLDWVGPTMSARSSMTARQMETWAHGHEVFDLLGLVRQEDDRLKNIVVLGVNTFGFSYSVRGKTVPPAMPSLRLTSPSGEIWEFGDENAGQITGSAQGFAQAVTQTRHYLDTDLTVQGQIATEWMENAQCFAGPPEPVPERGSRHMQ